MSDATDRTHDETDSAGNVPGDDHDDQPRALTPPTEADLIRKFRRNGTADPVAPLPYIPAPKGMPPRLPLDSPFWEPWRTF